MGKKVGFIGLGLMGGNMARRLMASGYEIVGYDIDAATAESIRKEGAIIVDSAAQVARETKIICTSLPNPQIVSNVFLDPQHGIVNVAAEGTIVLDFSTVDPNTTRKSYEYGKLKGISVLDCPVSAGPPECLNGKAVIIVGGDRDAMEKVDDILKCLATTIHYAGPSGAGNIVKIVNNAIGMGTLVISAEAFVLGVKAGVSPDTLFNILSTSGAKSYHFLKRFPNALAGNFNPGARLSIAVKDLGLALDMSKMMSVPMTALGTTHELYIAANAMGLGDEDFVAVIKYFERLAGVEARSQQK